jgi:hypothetical protein
VPEDGAANTSVDSVAAEPAKPQRVPPALVGIGWVIRCREEKARVSEDEYRVDLREQAVFQKVRRRPCDLCCVFRSSADLSLCSLLQRRKSMEPKHMFATAELPSSAGGGSVQQSIDQARRKSMQFARTSPSASATVCLSGG